MVPHKIPYGDVVMSSLAAFSRRSPGVLAATATAAAATLLTAAHHHSISTQSLTEDLHPPSDRQPLEVHILEKIRNKPYLQGSHDTIPERLRLLVIDLPDLPLHIRDADCRISHSHLFPDDIAKPKRLDWKEYLEEKEHTTSKNNHMSTSKSESKQVEIAQKAVVKSLRSCRGQDAKSKIGLDILEASIADLNKYKLRKTHQVGTYRYDPGKYYNDPGIADYSHIDATSEETALVRLEPFQELLEAPWNQYAWAEELRLRIHGQIGFAAPLEPSSRLNWRGNAYRITHFPIHHFWEWPLPPFAKSDPDGVDGHVGTRASQKPHAVLANGAALQRVPSSMRLLQKLCQKADVPLFVVYDPRSWGGNTHASLPSALADLRSVIKQRMISKALQEHGSTAFSRGRLLGQIETETKWRLREQKRKSKELFRGMNRERPNEDWSGYDANRLERRLAQRGVIQETTTSDGEGASIILKVYSNALVELARRCVGDIDERVSDEESAGGDTKKMATPSVSSSAEDVKHTTHK